MKPLFDPTSDSGTLPHFEPDLPDDPEAIEMVLDGLARAFAIPAIQLARWQHELNLLTSNLELKKSIVRVVVSRIRKAPNPHSAVLKLFQSIYGPWPFRSGDIELFAAEGALIFAAPFEDGVLKVDGYDERPTNERFFLKTYLREVAAGAWRTDRFPGFGALDRSALDSEFLEGLVSELDEDVATSAVRDTLHSMVTFITLPSSSLLRDSPIKHDLTVKDIHFHYRRWRESFRKILDDPGERGRLAGEVSAALGTEIGTRSAVDHLAELVRDKLEATALSSRRSVERSAGDRIEIDMLQRTQAAAAFLDMELTQQLARGELAMSKLRDASPNAPRWHCPSACVDLLVLLLGWFFERDRNAWCWHLDVLVGEIFPDLLQRLDEALSFLAERKVKHHK